MRSTGSNGSTSGSSGVRRDGVFSGSRQSRDEEGTRGCRRGGRRSAGAPGSVGDDGSGWDARATPAIRDSRRRGGTPAPIETVGKAKKKTKTKKKASSPQPRQRRSSPSPSPSSSSSSSSGLKKLKNLEKALRALKARPRVAKKRAERRATTTSHCLASHRVRPNDDRSYLGRTAQNPRARARWTRGRRRRWRGLIRPKSARRAPVAPPPPTFRPNGDTLRPLGAVPRRPPREPFEPPSSFRAPSPPSPTPLDDEELSRFEAHWDKENARHRYAATGDKAGTVTLR